MAKTKGARKIHDRLLALWLDEDDCLEQLKALHDEFLRIQAEGKKLAIYNPPAGEKALIRLGDIESKRREIEARRAEIRAEIRVLYHEKIEPYMERANPTVDARLHELEERILALERMQRDKGPQWRVMRGDDRAAEK